MVIYENSCTKPFEREHPVPSIIAIGELAAKEGYDPLHEAAFFYGLYLRGEPIEQIRKDIDVPNGLVSKWAADSSMDEQFRRYLHDVYAYRQKVLVIFEILVASEQRFSLQ